jgi:hypothetical protein
MLTRVEVALCSAIRGQTASQDAVMRLAEVPGLGVDSAQPIVAEARGASQLFGARVDSDIGKIRRRGQNKSRGARTLSARFLSNGGKN